MSVYCKCYTSLSEEPDSLLKEVKKEDRLLLGVPTGDSTGDVGKEAFKGVVGRDSLTGVGPGLCTTPSSCRTATT